MSETTTETTTSETEASADKRERRTFPIRLLAQDASGAWQLLREFVHEQPFTTIDAAEKWIVANGAPGVAYMMARVIGAKRRPPAKLEDVPL